MNDKIGYYAWGQVNDEDASARLTHQHFLITRLFGWHLHPRIERLLQSDPSSKPKRIADVACGNGIWATDVANTKFSGDATIEVTGFDINSSLFPKAENMLPNVRLALWDVFEPPAKEYEGTFDVVNLRLLFGAVPSGDPRPIVRNLIKLLKPGGYLQWLEYDFDNPVVSETSAWARLPQIFTLSRSGHSNKWVTELDDILENEGLDHVEMIRKLPQKEFLKYWQDNWYVSVRELVRGVRNPKVDELWEACDREKNELGYVPSQTPIVLVTGQRKG